MTNPWAEVEQQFSSDLAFTTWLSGALNGVCAASRAFNGDTQGAILLLALLVASKETPTRPGRKVAELAALTGIPRETVRRRMLALESSGYARRMPRAGWCWSASTAGAN